MTKSPRKILFLLLVGPILLSSCKIEISVPRGGYVSSIPPYYECHEFQTCQIDVTDIYFDEVFGAASPSGDFVFSHWKKRDNSLCGNSSQLCELSTRNFNEHPLLMAFLESDEKFHLEPVFFRKQYLVGGAGEVHPKIRKERIASGYAHPDTELEFWVFNRQESDIHLLKIEGKDGDNKSIDEYGSVTKTISRNHVGIAALFIRNNPIKVPITMTLLYRTGSGKSEESLVFTFYE